ncbi:MAG TPA: hypothetical protein DCP32_11390 [Anaerolineaceae bacterium]|nr:hypothetical protein [Anaerolineaceae bacterium]
MGGRYGTFKYGSQKYGTSGNQNILWAVQIDWDADGVFDGTNEAQYMTDFSVVRGRHYYINSDGSGFEPMSVGRVDLTLTNGDRRFDPWYTHGPLYGKISPGKKAQIWLRYLGVTRSIFAGYISDIQPISGDYSRVRVTILDGIQYLIENPVSVLLRQNISHAAGIGAILDAIEWPTIWGRSLETGIAELAYWWADGEKSRTAIQSLVDANFGAFFVAADGKAKFYTRNHVSISVVTVAEADLKREVVVPQPWEVVRNKIQIIAHPLAAQSISDLWRMGDTPGIGPGETLTIFANFEYGGKSCPAINVINPVATTDYLANTQSDGLGTNLTGSLAVTSTVFSKTAKLDVTNNSSELVYPIMLKIRGNAVIEIGAGTVEAQDGASQTAYGKRSFNLDNPWVQNVNTAQAFANYIKANIALPRAFPQVQLEGRPDIQFKPDLFDAVTLQLPSLGISDDYHVGHIEHHWLDEGGQSVRTTWKLETFENININAWKFPANIGVSTYFGY